MTALRKKSMWLGGRQGGRREAFPLARGPARRRRRGWARDTRDAVFAQPSPSAAPGPSPPPPKPWGSPEPQARGAVPVQPRSSRGPSGSPLSVVK